MEEGTRQFGCCHPDGGGGCGADNRYRQQRDHHDPAHLGQAADGTRPRYPAEQTGIGTEFERVRRDRKQRDELEERAGACGCSQRLTSTVKPKVSAAPVTMATRLSSDPRATTAASGETADGASRRITATGHG